VLGAGLAGSLAALVCERAGHDVLLIERDPDVTGPRPGAPHGRQLHNILGRAQRHLTDLVPGFERAFLAGGGQRATVASQTHVYERAMTMPERDLGLQIWSARKEVIDRAVSGCLDDSRVRWRLGCRAEGARISGDRVVGVTVDGAHIEADLLIDTMGAKSPVSRWLVRRPSVHEYVVRQWYTTMVVRRPTPWVGRPDFWLVFPTYPRTRGGLVSPIDEHTWHVSLSGGPGDEPPGTPAEFVAYAATLEDPAVGELLAVGEPAGPPRTFRKPVATWRRYDQGPPAPAGLLSAGDAVADLNPLIGQGMSVAAWQLSELSSLLAEGGDLATITARFRALAAEAVNAAWNLITLYDEGVGDVTLAEAEWDELLRLVATEADVHRRYVEVWHLLRPVTDLPAIAAGKGTASPKGASA
jgi:flavin-dependent dehydrogenase